MMKPIRLTFDVGCYFPGIALTSGIALTAMAIQRASGIPELSPLVLAMIIGMALRTSLGPIALTGLGIAFSMRRILRAGIVLLGFQLTATQVLQVGLGGVLAIAVTLVATFAFTRRMGRVLGVDPQLAELIAAGTSICGASAILACNTVTRGRDEHVAYAMACVTIFGSVAMILFPLLAVPLSLSPAAYGLWVGTSLHEVAQVVAASFAQGDAAGQAGTVAKLCRVMMLAPVILSLGLLASRGPQKIAAKAPAPWFVFGFIAVVGLNSAVEVPPLLQGHIVAGTSFLLTVALAAMGLETDIGKLRMQGLRPLALGAIASVFVATLGLAMIRLLA